MSEADRIMGLVKKTMAFALKTYPSQWEAAVSLLVASRMIARKADIDWAEMVTVVETLMGEVGLLPPKAGGN